MLRQSQITDVAFRAQILTADRRRFIRSTGYSAIHLVWRKVLEMQFLEIPPGWLAGTAATFLKYKDGTSFTEQL